MNKYILIGICLLTGCTKLDTKKWDRDLEYMAKGKSFYWGMTKDDRDIGPGIKQVNTICEYIFNKVELDLKDLQ